MKFELGEIDTRLAPLWMSKHRFSTKSEEVASDQREDDPITRAIKEDLADGLL